MNGALFYRGMSVPDYERKLSLLRQHNKELCEWREIHRVYHEWCDTNTNVTETFYDNGITVDNYTLFALGPPYVWASVGLQFHLWWKYPRQPAEHTSLIEPDFFVIEQQKLFRTSEGPKSVITCAIDWIGKRSQNAAYFQREDGTTLFDIRGEYIIDHAKLGDLETLFPRLVRDFTHDE